MAFQSFVPYFARELAFTKRRLLDGQLATGVNPRSDPALGLRAAQLCRGRVRRGIARQLRRTAAAAEEASTDGFSSAPLARSDIRAEADALMELVRRLEARRPVEALAVALAEQLACDSNSPPAVGAEPARLHIVVCLATVALNVTPGHRAPAGRTVTAHPTTLHPGVGAWK